MDSDNFSSSQGLPADVFLEAFPDFIFHLDKNGVYLDLHINNSDDLYFSVAGARGKAGKEFLPPGLFEVEMANVKRVITTGHSLDYEFHVELEGEERYYEARCIPVKDLRAVLFVREITGRKQAEAKLLEQAFYDSLTALPNRFLFEERIRQALLRASSKKNYLFALLFLDLDRFKHINDTMGHQAGDQLLVQAAARLKGVIRESDTVARLGGDEFVILLDDIDGYKYAAVIADRIQSLLKMPFHLEEGLAMVGGSVGVAMSDTGYNNSEDMLRDADTAMYRAKNRGRSNREIFDKETNARLLVGNRMRNDLERALGLRELNIHYQPIYDLKTAKIVGMEALLRWIHPARGLLSASEFLEYIDVQELNFRLNKRVLSCVCSDLARWRELSLKQIPVSINLAFGRLAQSDIVQLVQSRLDSYSLGGEALDILVKNKTLSTLVGEEHNQDGVNLETLTTLKTMGCLLTLDNFGADFFSLSQVLELNFDRLKIDLGYPVADPQASEESQDPLTRTNELLSGALISLAARLKLPIIAKKVETAEQVDLLSRSGGSMAQGFYYSRPLPALEMAKLLAGERVSSS